MAVFWDPINRKNVSDIEAAAQSLGLKLRPIEVPAPYDFDSVLRVAKKEKRGAVFVLFSPGLLYPKRVRLAKLHSTRVSPQCSAAKQFVEVVG